MQCLFCEIANNKIPSFKIWENEDFFVFLDIMPINPGHLLLVPKKHFEEVYDLPEELYGSLFKTIKVIAERLKKATKVKRIGIAIEGFGMPHAHVHLVPVNKGNELNPERAKKASEFELQEMQKNLLTFFESLS